jgi:hypothetical protein
MHEARPIELTTRWTTPPAAYPVPGRRAAIKTPAAIAKTLSNITARPISASRSAHRPMAGREKGGVLTVSLLSILPGPGRISVPPDLLGPGCRAPANRPGGRGVRQPSAPDVNGQHRSVALLATGARSGIQRNFHSGGGALVVGVGNVVLYGAWPPAGSGNRVGSVDGAGGESGEGVGAEHIGFGHRGIVA